MGRWFAVVAVGCPARRRSAAACSVSAPLDDGARLERQPGSLANGCREFTADDFWIEANGRRFTSAVPGLGASIRNATYRTLEVTWQEHGVEMRLFLY
jgi:hypothetical protein